MAGDSTRLPVRDRALEVWKPPVNNFGDVLWKRFDVRSSWL